MPSRLPRIMYFPDTGKIRMNSLATLEKKLSGTKRDLLPQFYPKKYG